MILGSCGAQDSSGFFESDLEDMILLISLGCLAWRKLRWISDSLGNLPRGTTKRQSFF